MPNCELYLLGRPEIRYQGQKSTLKSRKALALLAILACEPGECSRTRLASMLWESFPESRAAANLRHAVHSLKGQFPQLLVVSDSTLSLAQEVWVDFEQSDSAVFARGVFCEGLRLSDCAAFDTWLTAQRTRWSDRALELCLQEAQEQEQQGCSQRALETARRALSADPLSERAHAMVIRLLRERGDLGAARRQWDLCVESTLRELGSVPSGLACWGPALSENTACRIYLLGKPRLVMSGQVIPLPYQKTTALLAYLASAEEAPDRQQVRSLLWPSSDPTKAAANLRHAIHFLRKILGSVLCTHEESLWLDRARFWLDADWLKSEAAPVESLGEFCEGLSLPDCAAFEHWLSEQRRSFAIVPQRPVQQPPAARPAGNLPAQMTSLVGASARVAQAAERLSEARLLTIIGPAGVGKTRLALELGRTVQERGPVWLVELGSLFDPERLLSRVAGSLGIAETPGEDLAQQLEVTLNSGPATILIDNCEHLISAVAELVARLLRRCPQLKMVATSRELLRIPGETIVTLDPLEIPPTGTEQVDALLSYSAVELFVSRARSANPRFRLEPSNGRQVASICRRLDGLPLAIELAAVRTRALSPEQIASGLKDRFRLLRGGPRTVPQRQQTLEAALAWSYDLMSAEEQQLFRDLSVFAGSFDLEAATQVSGAHDHAAVFDALTGLIDRSMILSQDSASGFRYRMLESVRDFAYRKLEREAEFEEVRGRHFEVFLARAQERQVPGVVGLSQLEEDHGNFSLSLQWAFLARPEGALRLAAALGDYWFYKGYFSEGSAYLESALAHAECPKALLWSGRLHQAQGDYGRASEEFEQSAAIAEEPLDQARALNARAQAGFSQGDYRGSVHFAETGLKLWKAASHSRGEVDTLNILATAEICLGEWELATERLRESLRLSQGLDYAWGRSGARYLMGLKALFLGNNEQAQADLELSLEECRELGNALRTAACLGNLALTSMARGELEQAQLRLEEGAALAESSGYKGVEAFLLYVRGVVELRGGDSKEARDSLKASLRILTSIHVRESSELVLLCLAEAVEDPKLSRTLRTAALDFKKQNHSIVPKYLDWLSDELEPDAPSLSAAIELAIGTSHS